MIKKDYIQFLESVKHLVLVSRYNAAHYVNREVLVLYYVVGRMLSSKIKGEGWGAKVLSNIANDIQKDIPGIRGFSITNLKNMKAFYEKYAFLDHSDTELDEDVILLLSTLKAISEKKTARKRNSNLIGQTASDQLQNNHKKPIGQTPSDQLDSTKSSLKKGPLLKFNFQNFFAITFSHHLILLKITQLDELIFYIDQTILNQWSVNLLKFNI